MNDLIVFMWKQKPKDSIAIAIVCDNPCELFGRFVHMFVLELFAYWAIHACVCERAYSVASVCYTFYSHQQTLSIRSSKLFTFFVLFEYVFAGGVCDHIIFVFSSACAVQEWWKLDEKKTFVVNAFHSMTVPYAIYATITWHFHAGAQFVLIKCIRR